MAATDKEKKYPDWWYQSANQKELDSLAGQIESRPDFKFKVDHEALYDYYKGEYDRQGREAKLDTEAKGAALTGGYGNSYARQAGQQAYEEQVEGLQENVAPDLWQMALDKYTREGKALVDRYSALQKQEKADYEAWEEEHADEIEAWEKEQAEAEREREEAAKKAAEERRKEEYRSTEAYDQAVRSYLYGELPVADSAEKIGPAYDWSPVAALKPTTTHTSSSGREHGGGGGKIPDPDPVLENNGYGVTSYPKAVSRLRNMGVSQDVMQGLLTEAEWERLRGEAEKAAADGEGTINLAVVTFDSYIEYLRFYVTAAEKAKNGGTPGYTGHYNTGIVAGSNRTDTTGNRWWNDRANTGISAT